MKHRATYKTMNQHSGLVERLTRGMEGLGDMPLTI